MGASKGKERSRIDISEYMQPPHVSVSKKSREKTFYPFCEYFVQVCKFCHGRERNESSHTNMTPPNTPATTMIEAPSIPPRLICVFINAAPLWPEELVGEV